MHGATLIRCLSITADEGQPVGIGASKQVGRDTDCGAGAQHDHGSGVSLRAVAMTFRTAQTRGLRHIIGGNGAERTRERLADLLSQVSAGGGAYEASTER